MLFFTAIRGIFYLELGLRRHLIADLTEELGVPIVKTRKYMTNEASFSVRTYARTRERRNRRGSGTDKARGKQRRKQHRSIGYNTGVFLGSRNECIIE